MSTEKRGGASSGPEWRRSRNGGPDGDPELPPEGTVPEHRELPVGAQSQEKFPAGRIRYVTGAVSWPRVAA